MAEHSTYAEGLELMLLLGMAGALIWGAQGPPGGAGPHALPGLEQAHRQIDSLQANSLVLVNWAYDPATAGEMDLVAQPIIEHLLQEQAKLIVFSQLPGGPAACWGCLLSTRPLSPPTGRFTNGCGGAGTGWRKFPWRWR